MTAIIENRAEFFLEHQHATVELKMSYDKDTLVHLHHLWKRPVHIASVWNDSTAMLSFDGSEHDFQKFPKGVIP